MAKAESALIFTVEARLCATFTFTRAASCALTSPVALAPLLMELELAAPEEGEVTPDGDMLGDVLGDVVLGDVVLGDVVLVEASLLVEGVVEVEGIVEGEGVAEVEGGVDGSLTLPFEVVVVLRRAVSVGESLSGVLLDVSLCVVLDCPVLGWLVVLCAATGIANAASITAASVYRCVIVSESPARWWGSTACGAADSPLSRRYRAPVAQNRDIPLGKFRAVTTCTMQLCATSPARSPSSPRSRGMSARASRGRLRSLRRRPLSRSSI
jgi:hypothetical protein